MVLGQVPLSLITLSHHRVCKGIENVHYIRPNKATDSRVHQVHFYFVTYFTLFGFATEFYCQWNFIFLSFFNPSMNNLKTFASDYHLNAFTVELSIEPLFKESTARTELL